MKRNIGGLVAVVLTVLGLTAVVFAFMTNASPYVTIAEAKARPADNQHLSGDILPGTMAIDYKVGAAQFGVKDQEGQTITVAYKGSIPPNMSTATKVVAVGGVKHGVFQSEKLMLKCPSKYETEGKK